MRFQVTLAIALLLLLVPNLLLAESCLNYEDYYKWLAAEATPRGAKDLRLTGNYAFVADSFSGLQIIDISQPTDPVLVQELAISGESLAIDVAGDFAYLATWWYGLQIVNIADPLEPELVGALSGLGLAVDVACQGDLAFVATPDSGFQVIDVQDPTSPTVIGRLPDLGPGPENRRGVAVQGDHVYLANGYDGFFIIDIQDPTDPIVEGTLFCGGFSREVYVQDQMVYLADAELGFFVVDASNPADPKIVGSFANEDQYYYYRTVYIQGNRAFLGAGDGLDVLDISDPSQPVFLGEVALAGRVNGIRMVGDIAFCANSDIYSHGKGFEVIDVSGSGSASLAAAMPLPTEVREVLIHTDHAFFCGYDNQLHIVDISDPAQYKLITSVSYPSGVTDIAIENSLAYLTVVWDGLFILDIQDLENPTPISQITLGSEAVSALDVAGSYAYVTCQDFGLWIIDIADPQRPEVLSVAGPTEYNADILISGDICYLANRVYGLYVYDVSDPYNPQLLQIVSEISSPQSLELVGDILFATAGGWLLAYDVTEPGNAYVAGAYDTGSGSLSLAVDRNMAYLVTSHVGMQVYDVSNIEQIQFLGTVDTPSTAFDLELRDDYIYIADGHGGMQVAYHQCDYFTDVNQTPPSPLRLETYPNPFNPKTTISFTIPKAGETSLTILDPSGRVIARPLRDEQLSSGHHTVNWGGVATDGSPQASGVYLCNLKSGGYQITRKMTLIK